MLLGSPPPLTSLGDYSRRQLFANAAIAAFSSLSYAAPSLLYMPLIRGDDRLLLSPILTARKHCAHLRPRAPIRRERPISSAATRRRDTSGTPIF